MKTRLEPEQVKAIVGQCFACMHAKGKVPGEDEICKICLRSTELDSTSTCCLRPDKGRMAYGARDCYIAKDRFDMELLGMTFIKSMKDRNV